MKSLILLTILTTMNFAVAADRKCVLGFCEEVDNYPEDTIRKLLQQNKQFEAFFNMPVGETAMRASTDDNSCNTTTLTTFPRSAINIKNQKVLIASTEQYKQTIQLEICGKPDGACDYSKLLPSTYETKCKQKYITTPLIYTIKATKVKEAAYSYVEFLYRDKRSRIVRGLHPTDRNCTAGFCEQVQGYPENKVKQLIEQNKEYHTFFNIPPPKKQMRAVGMEGLCSSIVNTIQPRAAVNTKNERVLLANVGDYRQQIEAELCNSVGNPCTYSNLLPSTYQTKCVQRHTTLALLAIVDDQLKIDTFKTPSCCVCMYKTV